MKNLIYFLLPLFLHAIDFAPWMETALYPRNDLKYRFEVGHHAENHILQDNVTMTVIPPYELQGAIRFLGSRRNSFGPSSIDLAGGYLFFNDRVGDPLSLKGTFVLGTAVPRFTRDHALFEPGPFRAEAHLSVGKESLSAARIDSAFYGDFGMGIASRGPSWLRFEAVYKKRLCYLGFLTFRTLGIYQWSAKKSFELLGGYESAEDWYGTLSIELGARLAAARLPHAALIQLAWSVPFGLGL